MQRDCETVRDDISAHALGALDGDEARALEAHVATCAECAAQLDRAAEDAAALALSAPLTSSSAALKARVMASAAVLGDLSRSRGRWRWWHAAAAALVVLSAGALTWGVLMQRRVDGLESRNASAQQDAAAQAVQLATVRAGLDQMTASNAQLADIVNTQDTMIEIMSQPDARHTTMNATASAPAASAHYLWSPGADVGALVAENLPPLPDGKAYQMWVVYGDQWVPGGTFVVDASGSGRLIVRPAEGGDPDGAMPSWFCVTVEPASGADRPTGAMMLRSTGA